MKSIFYILIILAGISLIDSSTAYSCSVCQSGDNAFQFANQALTLSGQTSVRHFQLGIGNRYFNKSNALSPIDGIGTESERELRPSVKLTYISLNHFALSAELPVSFRRLKVADGAGISREHSSGFGDAELSGLWMANLYSRDGKFYSGGISAALKMPTGPNNSRQDGVRIDEHLQSGTGSYDYILGGALVRATCQSRLYSSIYYRHNGTNSFNYHYGNATLFNLGFQRAVYDWLSGSLELNVRHALRDIEDSATAPNTGGSVAYLTPGLRIAVGKVTSLALSVQIPTWKNLYGQQTEKPVFLTGVNIIL